MRNQNASLDVSAKTVDEAIVRGLNQLGKSREEVDIDIVNEGKRGIFGLGAEDAVVRLTVKPVEKEEPQSPPPPLPERAEEPAVESDTDSQPEEPPAVTTPEALIEETIKEATSAQPAAPQAPAAPQPEDKTAQPSVAEEAEETPEAKTDQPSVAEEAEETTEAAPTEAEQVPLEIAKKHLENLLDLMGVEADVVVEEAPALAEEDEEPPTVLDITGKDLGILIGRRSETLQALQYLVRLMVSKEMKSWQRITVDVESYRSRRLRSLQKMAKRMAERAVANQERVVLEAMTAYERRIIHITLRDHPAVYTKSIGRDHNRKVTIIPK